MEQTKSIGIWIRVSTEMQVKDESPEVHEKRARMYAESKGWNIKTVYKLEAVSGKSVIEHPEAKRMLSDVRNGIISGIIFSKLARLARNTRELLEFAEIFRQHNADLISLTESIDTSSSAGRLFYTMIAALSEWERSEIADRVRASVPIRAQMGKPLGGQASLGYRWDGKELVIDENEAPIRRKVYELFKIHKRKGTVSKVLNEMGHRTRNGSKFTDTTIGRLLADSTAKGIRRANYTKSLGDGKQWVIKPESEWIMLKCPSVVSSELWDECYAILDEQEKKNKKPTRKAVHLFTGILLCECGSKMYVPSDSKKYICLNCRKHRIAIEDIEEIYYENLKTFLLTDKQIEIFISKTDETIRSKENELQLLETKLKRVEGEMDKVMELHISGQIPKNGFSKYYAPLDEQKKQIEDSIPQLLGEVDFLKMEKLNGTDLMDEAKNLYDRWPTLFTEEKRNIVEQITNSITIEGDTINIKFSYTPTLFQIDPVSQRNLMDS